MCTGTLTASASSSLPTSRSPASIRATVVTRVPASSTRQPKMSSVGASLSVRPDKPVRAQGTSSFTIQNAYYCAWGLIYREYAIQTSATNWITRIASRNRSCVGRGSTRNWKSTVPTSETPSRLFPFALVPAVLARSGDVHGASRRELGRTELSRRPRWPRSRDGPMAPQSTVPRPSLGAVWAERTGGRRSQFVPATRL